MKIFKYLLSKIFQNKKNNKFDLTGFNFRGYANRVTSTDIKLPPPIPLQKIKKYKNKNYKLKKTKPKDRPYIPSTGVIIKKGLC